MTQAPSRPADTRQSLLSDFDLYLFNEGTHVRVYEKLGAHVAELDGTQGVVFGVWAPNADAVANALINYQAGGDAPATLQLKGDQEPPSPPPTVLPAGNFSASGS